MRTLAFQESSAIRFFSSLEFFFTKKQYATLKLTIQLQKLNLCHNKCIQQHPPPKFGHISRPSLSTILQWRSKCGSTHNICFSKSQNSSHFIEDTQQVNFILESATFFITCTCLQSNSVGPTAAVSIQTLTIPTHQPQQMQRFRPWAAYSRSSSTCVPNTFEPTLNPAVDPKSLRFPPQLHRK